MRCVVPIERRTVNLQDAGPTDVIGTVEALRRLPPPYDGDVDRILRRLRARLFELVEVGMQPHQLESARQRVRDITIDAVNDVRRMVLDILYDPPTTPK